MNFVERYKKFKVTKEVKINFAEFLESNKKLIKSFIKEDKFQSLTQPLLYVEFDKNKDFVACVKEAIFKDRSSLGILGELFTLIFLCQKEFNNLASHKSFGFQMEKEYRDRKKILENKIVGIEREFLLVRLKNRYVYKDKNKEHISPQNPKKIFTYDMGLGLFLNSCGDIFLIPYETYRECIVRAGWDIAQHPYITMHPKWLLTDSEKAEYDLFIKNDSGIRELKEQIRRIEMQCLFEEIKNYIMENGGNCDESYLKDLREILLEGGDKYHHILVLDFLGVSKDSHLLNRPLYFIEVKSTLTDSGRFSLSKNENNFINKYKNKLDILILTSIFDVKENYILFRYLTPK